MTDESISRKLVSEPIVAPEALREKGIRHVIVMNPNYEQEVTMQAGGVDPAIRVHVADRL